MTARSHTRSRRAARKRQRASFARYLASKVEREKRKPGPPAEKRTDIMERLWKTFDKIERGK